MRYFAFQGFPESYVALGYKDEVIERFFIDAWELSGNLTVDVARSTRKTREHTAENWLVHRIETARDSNTARRLKRLQKHLDGGT